MGIRRVLFLSLCYLIFFAASAVAQVGSQSETGDLNKNYQKLIKKLSPKRVHPHLIAVHLWLRKEKEGGWLWQGSGTLVLDAKGIPLRIVTAGHIFSRKFPKGYYAYEILTPRERTLHEIAQGEPLFGKDMNGKRAEEDVALLTPGPRQLIGSFSSHAGGSSWTTMKNSIVFIPLSVVKRKEELTALATGEKVPIIGEGWFVGGNGFFVLGYGSFPGESGAGFINDKNKLFVLMGGFKVDEEIRKVLPAAAGYKLISFASGVRVEIQ